MNKVFASRAAGLALLPILLLSACTDQPKPSVETAPIVLTIAKQQATLADFHFYLKRTYPEVVETADDELRSILFDSFRREVVLAEVAKAMGYEVTEDRILEYFGEKVTTTSFHLLTLDEQFLWKELIGRRLAVRDLLRNEVVRRVSVSEEAIHKYYQNHSEQFRKEKTYRLRMLQTLDQQKADSFHQALRKSKQPFMAVAEEYADHEGYKLVVPLTMEALLTRFQKEVAKLRPGTYTKVIPVKHGEQTSYYVLYLEEEVPEEKIGYDDAYHDIRSSLEQSEAEQVLQNLIQQFEARFDIVIHRDALTFTYIDAAQRSEK